MNQSIVNFIHSSLRGQPPPIAKLLFDKKVLGFHFISCHDDERDSTS